MRHLFICENCGKIFQKNDNEDMWQWRGYPLCSKECGDEFVKKQREEQLMSNNYIMLNGEKVELTDEQIKGLTEALQKPRKQKIPFDKVKPDEIFYSCGQQGVEPYHNSKVIKPLADKLYENTNYFNDKDFACQVSLHQLLYRKLLKFAYENDCGNDTEWNYNIPHYHIAFDHVNKHFAIDNHYAEQFADVYFNSYDVARQAIDKVIKPFMTKYPEFKW